MIQKTDVMVSMNVAEWQQILRTLRSNAGNVKAIYKIEKSMRLTVEQHVEEYKNNLMGEIFEDNSLLEETQELAIVKTPKLHPLIKCLEDEDTQDIALDEEEAPVLHRAAFTNRDSVSFAGVCILFLVSTTLILIL